MFKPKFKRAVAEDGTPAPEDSSAFFYKPNFGGKYGKRSVEKQQPFGETFSQNEKKRGAFMFKPKFKRAIAEDGTAAPEDDVAFFWKPNFGGKYGKRSVDETGPFGETFSQNEKKRGAFMFKPKFKRAVAEDGTPAPEDSSAFFYKPNFGGKYGKRSVEKQQPFGETFSKSEKKRGAFMFKPKYKRAVAEDGTPAPEDSGAFFYKPNFGGKYGKRSVKKQQPFGESFSKSEKKRLRGAFMFKPKFKRAVAEDGTPAPEDSSAFFYKPNFGGKYGKRSVEKQQPFGETFSKSEKKRGAFMFKPKYKRAVAEDGTPAPEDSGAFFYKPNFGGKYGKRSVEKQQPFGETFSPNEKKRGAFMFKPKFKRAVAEDGTPAPEDSSAFFYKPNFGGKYGKRSVKKQQPFGESFSKSEKKRLRGAFMFKPKFKRAVAEDGIPAPEDSSAFFYKPNFGGKYGKRSVDKSLANVSSNKDSRAGFFWRPKQPG